MIDFFDLRAEQNKHFGEIGLFNLRMMYGRMRRAVVQSDRFRVSTWTDVLDYLDSPEGRSEYGFAFASLPSQPNGPVLAIGRGITPLPYAIAESGWRTFAANAEVASFQLLQQEGSTIFETKVENYLIDPRSLTLAPAQFEVVLAHGVLNTLYYADIPVALSEMFRVSRVGGKIVLTLCVSPHVRVETLNIFKPLMQDDDTLQSFNSLLNVEEEDVLLGICIQVPTDDIERQEIITRLREIALHLPYPPQGVQYQRIDTILNVPMWINNDSVMKNALTYGDFDTRSFEQDVHVFLEKFLRPNDVVFDVGANIGVHTVQMGQLLNGKGSVHAFEPAQDTFDCLIRNSLLTGGNLNLNPIGLSVENGALPLNKANGGQAALNSFGRPFGSGTSSLYESELSWTMTLDDYVRSREIEGVALIKIDVEGWEERVLRGGIATLLTHQPVILIELTSSAARNANSSLVTVTRLLQALGYELYRYVVDNNTLETLETDRENWRYTNAVAVPRTRFAAAQERLSGQVSALIETETSDIRLLLEENRSLRQRLTSGILDREITLLDQLLQHREADREARLAAIQHLQAKIQQLEQEAESNRIQQIAKTQSYLDQLAQLKQGADAHDAEKTEAYEKELAELKQQAETRYAMMTQTYEQQLANLQDRLDALYKDYEARMEVINALSQTVDAQEAHIRSIQQRKIVRFMSRLGRPLA